jgi:hypothetical protein
MKTIVSSKWRLTLADVKSILKGLAIAVGGAVVVTVVDVLSGYVQSSADIFSIENLKVLGSTLAVAIASTAVNAIRKYITETEYIK